MPAPERDLSIEAFGEGPFAPHGALQMHLDGDVIVYSAEGPFNLEAVIALGKARRAAMAQWTDRRRRLSIAIFKTSLLMSPEAFDAYALGLRSHLRESSPADAVAWVVPPDVQGRALVLPRFARLYAELGLRWQAFDTVEEARAWLAALPEG